MKKILRKLSIVNYPLSIVLLLLAAIMTLSACPAEVNPDNGEDPEDPELPVDPVDPGGNTENPVTYVMQTAALTGKITDAGGNPLSGVKVTTGTASATTGSDGMYTLDKAGTLDGRAVVRYEKSGYFAVTRSRTKADDMRIDAMLHPRGNTAISSSETFPASGAKTVTAGGLKIELPANAFATADGKEYTGTVHAVILFMGIDNPGTELMMPGSDLTTSTDGEMMIPAGMADAVFTGDDGKLLRIAGNTEATVTYTLPAEINVADLPATVPLWTFDEARGYWKEDGSATRQGNAYTGKVSHFSPRGAGFKSRLANINVTVTECDDKPAYWSEITLSETYDENDALAPLSRDDFRVPRGPFYIDIYGFTNVAVPARSLVRVTASWHGSRKTQTVRMGAGNTSTNVHFEFKEDCEEEEEEDPEGKGSDLVFNLKAGPTENSFIIAVSPAMPAYKDIPASPKEYRGRRIPPNIFLKAAKTGCFITGLGEAGVSPPNGGLIFTGCESADPKSSLWIADESGWNADFTEFTFYIAYHVPGEEGAVWNGSVRMNEPDNDMLAIIKFMQMVEINSITLGRNNTVSIRSVSE